jgi:hypothetical protein
MTRAITQLPRGCRLRTVFVVFVALAAGHGGSCARTHLYYGLRDLPRRITGRSHLMPALAAETRELSELC